MYTIVLIPSAPPCNITIKSIHAQYDDGSNYIFAGDDRQWKINVSLIPSKDKGLDCSHRIVSGYPNRFVMKWGKEIPDPSKIDEAVALPYGHGPFDTYFFVVRKLMYCSPVKKLMIRTILVIIYYPS